MSKTHKRTILANEVFEKWQADESYRAAYEALGDEFALAGQIISARANAGLTQQQMADRMKTSQAYIARLEGGKEKPSTSTLNRIADATQTHLVIRFESAKAV